MVAVEKKLSSEIVTEISNDVGISFKQVENTIRLLLDACTIPFIARYRKEVTEGLDEVQIRDIRDKHEYLIALIERKEAILKSISEQEKLTPELKKKIELCKSKAELEDIYLPYKPKKRTKGQIAKERGLENSALSIFMQQDKIDNLQDFFAGLIGTHADLTNKDIVIQGITDYLAEYIAENADIRKDLRSWMFENGLFRSAVKEEFKDKKTKYNDYYDFSEPIKSIASHRMLAIRRGEKEEVLSIGIEVDETVIYGMMESYVIKHSSSQEIKEFLRKVIKDSYSRFLSTGLETEIRLETRTRAEDEAISVFSKNMRNLLLLPPIPKKIVMGIDPGMRTGSKLVVLDATGKLLEYCTIYPDHDTSLESPKNDVSREKFINLLKKHHVECIAIGNGTGCREIEGFVEGSLKREKDLRVKYIVVNESGASVYSASDTAREEFPNLDITYRGSVSIGRRLQDPLAELVKIDPKSIGVGQYQHDVNQGKLKKTLEEVVESCVNYVGVNLNTASHNLLAYISGIGPSLSKNIVMYRNEKGEFKNRSQLLDIPGFGPKTFEQAAGFLRIKDGDNPLDNSAVHPEVYNVVEKMVQALNISVQELIGKDEQLQKINLKEFITQEVGLLTLNDIINELKKPGRDPRDEGIKHQYNRDLKAFSQLEEGQVVTGTVTNVTNFGAFVDIGVHQDGLIHISELSHTFIKNVAEFIAVGQQVQVKVIGVDKEMKRISLSKKALEAAPAVAPQIPNKEEFKRSPGQNSVSSKSNERKPQVYQAQSTKHSGTAKNTTFKDREKEEQQKKSPASTSDLLSKFNTNRL